MTGNWIHMSASRSWWLRILLQLMLIWWWCVLVCWFLQVIMNVITLNKHGSCTFFLHYFERFIIRLVLQFIVVKSFWFVWSFWVLIEAAWFRIWLVHIVFYNLRFFSVFEMNLSGCILITEWEGILTNWFPGYLKRWWFLRLFS